MILLLYFFNSTLTFGANKSNPIILGIIMAKTNASEKLITASKLAAAPMIINMQKNNFINNSNNFMSTK